MTAPLRTIGQEKSRRAVAVVHFSNGQAETLCGDWERVGSSLWESTENFSVPLNPGQLNSVEQGQIAPLLKQAKTFNIFPVRIEIYKEYRTEVIYKTTGYQRSLDRIKEFGGIDDCP